MTAFQTITSAGATVTCTPSIMGGMPCVGGTRVPAETVLDSIRHGAAAAGILDGYPYLPDGFYQAVLIWAKANGHDAQLPDRRVPDPETGAGSD